MNDPPSEHQANLYAELDIRWIPGEPLGNPKRASECPSVWPVLNSSQAVSISFNPFSDCRVREPSDSADSHRYAYCAEKIGRSCAAR